MNLCAFKAYRTDDANVLLIVFLFDNLIPVIDSVPCDLNVSYLPPCPPAPRSGLCKVWMSCWLTHDDVDCEWEVDWLALSTLMFLLPCSWLRAFLFPFVYSQFSRHLTLKSVEVFWKDRGNVKRVRLSVDPSPRRRHYQSVRVYLS